MVEGGEDGTDGVHAGHDVNPRHADLGGPPSTSVMDMMPRRLHGRVKSDLSDVARPARSECCRRWCPRELRQRWRQTFGFEVLKDHVGVGHQARMFLFLLDVDRLNALATVAQQEVRGHVFAVKAAGRAAPRTGIVFPRGLEFQHLGAEITKRLGRMRPARILERSNANAGQRLHTLGFPAVNSTYASNRTNSVLLSGGLESSVLVGLDLLAHVLGSSLGCLHGLSLLGGAVAFVVLCSIDKGGDQIVNHLLYHSLNGHVRGSESRFLWLAQQIRKENDARCLERSPEDVQA